VNNLTLSYVPGVIKHYFHGSKNNRKYVERHLIFKKYHYDPELQLTKDAQGVLVPTENFSKEFRDDILNYFKQRNEDE
jgi:hypothetical protein